MLLLKLYKISFIIFCINASYLKSLETKSIKTNSLISSKSESSNKEKNNSNSKSYIPDDILQELDNVNFKDQDDCDDIFKEPTKKKDDKDCKFANNCNGHGICKDGKCVCFDGWTSYDCSISLCINFCSNHGKCVGGKCICDAGYAGEDCSVMPCPNDCSNHGRCIVSINL